MSNTPDIKVRGIRSSIPSGYILGRTDAGTGDPHLISISDLAGSIVSTGKVAGGGSAGGGSSVYPTLTNGQLPIGSTGNNPVAATLTAGANITITNGAGSITIASSGGGGGSGLFNQVMSATPTAAGTGLSTWVNQGTATVTDGATGIALKDTGHAGLVVRMRTLAAPATPYTYTALIGFFTVGAANAWAGIGWYDGANKLHLIGLNFSGSWLWLVGQMNTPSSYGANSAATGGNFAPGLFWLRITDDGTNVTFYYGIDGDQFLQLFTVAKASGWLGATGYSNPGFFMSSSSNDSIATLLSWKKT